MAQLQDQVVQVLQAAGIDNPLLTVPKHAKLADICFPVFAKAKEEGKNPAELAQELAQQIKIENTGIEAVTAQGPFVNFTFKPQEVAKEVLTSIREQKELFGSRSAEDKNTYCMDYSHPNIAKPFGIGHLRSTVIGESNKRILQFLGHNVIGINYLGDWGTQFGKVICAFQRWGNEAELVKEPVPYLLSLYIKFHEEVKTDSALDDEARTIFAALEAGNEDYLALWKRFRELSLEEFNRMYELMGISFDEFRGESYYNEKVLDIIALCKEKNILTESDGALIVDFERFDLKLPPVIVVKSNGGTTYLARDIAAAIDRVENLRCSDLLYEVGQEQELHFKQLFAILKLLGFEWANRCRHLGHGFYRLPEGKMSTREGRTVLMEDVVQESIQRVKKIIEEKNPELAKGEEFEETARTVGVGAIAFFDLQSDRLKDVLFDWNRILDFQGETGPYVQYTHARICSILRKYEKEVSDVSYDLFTASEKEMFLKLQSFGSVVEQAAKHHKPHVICRYVLDVCQLFNEYYAKNQVISNDETLTATRVVFIDAIRQVLANAIRLLGMRAPQQM